MKRYINTLCLLIVILLGLVSCLKDSDTTTVANYNETAITGFSLTAVNRYTPTTNKNGNDTIVKSTLTVKSYPFSIDHYQRKIYNTDSLPEDCDLKHVLVSVTKSTYTGNIVIKNIDNDSLKTYSSTDSIDFTSPREFRAYNNTLQKYRAYTVEVNVKKGDYNRFKWEKMPNTTPDIKSVAVKELEDRTFKLTIDDGQTWSDEEIALTEDVSLMPVSSFQYVSFPISTVPGGTYHLLIGMMEDEFYDDMYTVWRKITDDNGDNGAWVCLMNMNSELVELNYPGYLPTAEMTSLVYHNDAILAIQSDGSIYESRDQGISWHKNSKYSLPTELQVGQRLVAKGDDEGYVWLYYLDGNETWRGKFIKK